MNASLEAKVCAIMEEEIYQPFESKLYSVLEEALESGEMNSDQYRDICARINYSVFMEPEPGVES